jgi:hypothetical protein
VSSLVSLLSPVRGIKSASENKLKVYMERDPERQRGVSHVFFTWRTSAALPHSAMALSLTCLDIRCALMGELVTVTIRFCQFLDPV